MKSVTFTYHDGQGYSCSLPGEQSGTYYREKEVLSLVDLVIQYFLNLGILTETLKAKLIAMKDDTK